MIRQLGFFCENKGGVMKKKLQYVLLLIFVFSVSAVYAQNKVVVIPLYSSTAKKLKNIVTVSPSNGDFTDPVAAVNSITDASINNPYLVVIGPGIYTLSTTLNMKPYVSITGSGQQTTKLTGAISTNETPAASTSSALVTGADNASINDLTLENTGGNTVSIALYNTGSSPTVKDVTMIASGGTFSFALWNKSSSSPIITDVIVSASGT